MSRRYLFASLLVAAIALAGVPSSAAGGRQATSRTTPLGVGDRAPDFTLESHTGGTITLSKTLERGPAVVVFYRGYW